MLHVGDYAHGIARGRVLGRSPAAYGNAFREAVVNCESDINFGMRKATDLISKMLADPEALLPESAFEESSKMLKAIKEMIERGEWIPK